MRKTLSLVLVFILLLSATGCESIFESIVPLNDIMHLIPEESPVSPQENSEDAVPVTDFVQEPDLPKLNKAEYIPDGSHVPVKAENYYQRSKLNDTEKKVYDKIVAAISEGKSVVDIKGYRYSKDLVRKVFDAVCDDYPQYFYLSNGYQYFSEPDSNIVNTLIIVYFDGKVSDQYNEKGTLSVAADRDAINRQIKIFNEKIYNTVSLVPKDLSDFEKEKFIYEYIQDSVAYDYEAAESIPEKVDDLKSHAYDAYGALCEGKSVCEGYTNLFQYLCCCVGIKATRIFGTGENEKHSWNAVCLDGEWYMVDVTWDDVSAVEDLYLYRYFNVTTDYITKNKHTITYDETSVPDCTATKYAFYNMCGLYVEKADAVPKNYKMIIDRAALNCEKFICVYFADKEIDFEKYCARFILSPDSELYKYIQSNNYNMKIPGKYYTVGDDYYLNVE